MAARRVDKGKACGRDESHGQKGRQRNPASCWSNSIFRRGIRGCLENYSSSNLHRLYWNLSILLPAQPQCNLVDCKHVLRTNLSEVARLEPQNHLAEPYLVQPA